MTWSHSVTERTHFPASTKICNIALYCLVYCSSDANIKVQLTNNYINADFLSLPSLMSQTYRIEIMNVVRFMCFVIQLYLDGHENTCSHISVSTWNSNLSVHNGCLYLWQSAYIFKLFELAWITVLLVPGVNVASHMHLVYDYLQLRYLPGSISECSPAFVVRILAQVTTVIITDKFCTRIVMHSTLFLDSIWPVTLPRVSNMVM